MPKGQPSNTAALLRELGSALKEVEDSKLALRRAKTRASQAMAKLATRTASSRNSSKRRRA